jgi:hypothetical protein
MSKGKFYVIVPPDKGVCDACPRPIRYCGVRERISSMYGVSEPRVVRCSGSLARHSEVKIRQTRKGAFSVEGSG